MNGGNGRDASQESFIASLVHWRLLNHLWRRWVDKQGFAATIGREVGWPIDPSPLFRPTPLAVGAALIVRRTCQSARIIAQCKCLSNL
jgi:hypothetical protein